MIVKNNLHPTKVFSYIWQELLITTIICVVIYFSLHFFQIKINIPFAPLGLLGSSIAFFLGFRNSASFARWSQASNFWTALHNQSRILGRQLQSFVNAKLASNPNLNAEEGKNIVRSMLNRQIALLNALRLQLRKQNNFEEIKPFLSKNEFEKISQKKDKVNYLMALQSAEFYASVQKGYFQSFDIMLAEGTFAQLNTQYANCQEGIKQTPIPKQYTYYTRLFVRTFVYLLPFSLLQIFEKEGVIWLLLPVSLLMTIVFIITEKIAEVNEEPFENRIQDVPMTAICRQIEIDLLEIIDEKNLPTPIEAKNGYLF